MPARQTKLLSLREFGEPVTIKLASDQLGLSQQTFSKLFLSTARRVQRLFGKQKFVEFTDQNSFRFTGVAGILTLSSRHRIEVTPKFLNSESSNWREDFLRIAALTRHGNLFKHNLISSSRHANADIFDIIAQSWLDLFESNQRALLRTYINTSWNDFSLDGDSDEIDLVIPAPEGFQQQGLRLSRSNGHNRTLRDAARILRMRTRSPENTLRLDRAVSSLDAALKEPHPRKHKPANLLRHPRWQPLLDLSHHLLSDYSIGYSGTGHAILPGYLMSTAEAWETLIMAASKQAFPKNNIKKTGYPLGKRMDHSGRTRVHTVTPDISTSQSGKIVVLADAKYKTPRDSDGNSASFSISAADVYESMAFLDATGCKTIFLIYPNSRDLGDDPLKGQPLESFSVRDKTITAIALGTGGISQPRGLARLAANLNKVVTSTLLSAQ
jgi:5-methylcytosine-specific restriction enzyme subunit McrC